MIVSHSARLLYFPPAKTGSATMRQVLMRYGGREVGRPGPVPKRHDLFIPDGCDDYFTFITVRHPLARYQSAYQFYTKGRTPIEDFIPPPWFGPISQAVAGFRIDAVLRLESLADDFARLPFARPGDLPCLNRSPVPHTPLPPAVADRVRRDYAADFAAYGY